MYGAIVNRWCGARGAYFSVVPILKPAHHLPSCHRTNRTLRGSWWVVMIVSMAALGLAVALLRPFATAFTNVSMPISALLMCCVLATFLTDALQPVSVPLLLVAALFGMFTSFVQLAILACVHFKIEPAAKAASQVLGTATTNAGLALASGRWSENWCRNAL